MAQAPGDGGSPLSAPGEGRSRLLALRFDVDSIRCIEEGIPALRRLADRLGVRFTFFVNMGRSFNWSWNLRHLLRRRSRAASGAADPHRGPGTGADGSASAGPLSLPTSRKLGWSGVVRTVALNPMLGDRYRGTFDALHADGHELGLHGGTDHVVWQRGLDVLDGGALERLYRPAADAFSARYGPPRAFASPGFRFNDAVLDLLDREGYAYASDMAGEEPLLPAGRTTWQVPVNVMGQGRVPLVEQGLARGRDETAIVDDIVRSIESRRWALMYGHPYVEGVRADLLEQVLQRVADGREIVTVGTYLERWRSGRAG